MEDERTSESTPGTEDRSGSIANDEKGDDAEGQALTWKVRRPTSGSAKEDVEGVALRPPPDDVMHGLPSSEEDEDEAEGHGGPTGPPVD